MKSLSIIVGAILLTIQVYAQSPRQYYHISNAWTDLNISGRITEKWSWQLENQDRRQDMQGDYNPSTTSGNPFQNLNQHIFRPWLHYQLNPSIRFSFLPIGWIGSNRFKDGVPSAFFSELRISPQITLTQHLGRLRIDHRLRYEFRWIGQNQSVENKSFIYGGDFSSTTQKERFRYQLKAILLLGKEKMEDKTWYCQASNELFVNIGEQVANTNLLDQNRVLIGLGYRINKNFSVEAGYMQQAIFRFTNSSKNNVDLNNILQLNFIISNVETLFK
jgi:hypothetical protein